MVALDGGRLAVQVSGRHARLAPVRNPYTVLARRAVEQTDADARLVGEGVGRNIVYELAKRIGEGLSLRRARVTWLTAHVEAGTALPVLRTIAGPVSADTLNTIARVIEPPHPHDAAVRALHISLRYISSGLPSDYPTLGRYPNLVPDAQALRAIREC